MIYIVPIIIFFYICLAYFHNKKLVREVNTFFNDLNNIKNRYINYIDVITIKDKYNLLYKKTKTFFHNKKIMMFKDIYIHLDKYVLSYNKQYIDKTLLDNKTYFDTILDYPLDKDQRVAIVTDEISNIVIAGAGCGKTSTMIGKIKYLIDKKHIDPSKILSISFTNAAVTNLKERLNIDDVECTTFHKLGMNILTEYNHKKPDIADNKLEEVVRKYLKDEVINDPLKYYDVITFFGYYLHIPYQKYDTLGEQYNDEKCYNLETLKSMTSHSLITYKNEIVRSYEELMIANYLYLNGIDYEYEKKYIIDISTSQYGEYHPDFYLVDYNIYLEHFGINEDGACPQLSSIEEKKYLNGIEWKRGIHKKHHTVLIETYSYYAHKGILFDELDKLLKKHHIIKKPIDYKEVYKSIISQKQNKEYASFISLICKFIKMFKGNNFDESKFNIFINDSNLEGDNFKKKRCSLFLNLTHDIYNYYEKNLKDNNQIDFDDMVNQAATIINNGFKYHDFNYIIVDEFQDTSLSRYNLLSAIKTQNKALLMVVGDDFQSIYRFSGCDLDLFIHFNKYFPHSKTLRVSSTHRNSQELIDIAGNFIMQNEEGQIKKDLISSIHIAKPISIFYYKNDEKKAYEDALKYLLDSGCKNILLLGRNNYDVKPFISTEEYNKLTRINKYPYKIDDHVYYSTVHRAKGLEYDGVIIANLKNATTGFPNKMIDDPIMDYVLLDKDKILYEEERRLFYVALTRTKTKCTLLVPALNPSCFVLEIQDKASHIISEEVDLDAPKCPRCKTGNLVIRTKDNNSFTGCSNYPLCKYHQKSLEILKSPLICHKCGGYLVKKEGPYGTFYGCTNYPLCKEILKMDNNGSKN